MNRRNELWRSARADWTAARAGGRALLVTAVGILLYEWSAGNETVTTLLITGLLRHHRSVPGVLVAGALAALIVLSEQVLSGLLFITAVARLPHLVESVVATVHQRFGATVPPYRQLPMVSRAGIAFVMGTSFVAVEDALAGEQHRRRSIVVSAATAGITVFLITGVIGGALIAADGTPFEGVVEVIYSIAGDWRFWVAVLLGPPAIRALWRWLRRRFRPVDEPASTRVPERSASPPT